MEDWGREEFGSLELWFCRCNGLGDGEARARSLLNHLYKAGGRFLRLQPDSKDRPVWEVDPDAGVRIDSDGSLKNLDFAHPLLGRSLFEPVALGQFPATCTLSFEPDWNTVIFSQSASTDEPDNLDALAHGQLALGLALYHRLQPRFGFIDENGSALDETRVLRRPIQENLRSNSIPYVFWANFLGPAIVRQPGPDSFLSAPGWKKTPLDDGGIAYVATESYAGWWAKPPAEIEKHFAERISRHVYNTDWLLAGGPEEIPFEVPNFP